MKVRRITFRLIKPIVYEYTEESFADDYDPSISFHSKKALEDAWEELAYDLVNYEIDWLVDGNWKVEDSGVVDQETLPPIDSI